MKIEIIKKIIGKIIFFYNNNNKYKNNYYYNNDYYYDDRYYRKNRNYGNNRGYGNYGHRRRNNYY